MQVGGGGGDPAPQVSATATRTLDALSCQFPPKGSLTPKNLDVHAVHSTRPGHGIAVNTGAVGHCAQSVARRGTV